MIRIDYLPQLRALASEGKTTDTDSGRYWVVVAVLYARSANPLR